MSALPAPVLAACAKNGVAPRSVVEWEVLPDPVGAFFDVFITTPSLTGTVRVSKVEAVSAETPPKSA